MTQAPTWATDLLAEIGREFKKDGVPQLRWRNATREYHSSGHTENGMVHKAAGFEARRFADCRIAITAGSWSQGQRRLLLHEIAHALLPGVGHTAGFQRTLCYLLEKHMAAIPEAIKLEGEYMKGFTKAWNAGEHRRLLEG